VSHRYCGRDFSDPEIAEIRRLIAEDPGRTRAELSRLTCRALRWYKADGGLKDMSARVAMLRMHADGLITLPPPRRTPPAARVSITARTDPGPPLRRPAHELTSLRLQRVQYRHDSRLWNEYIHRYHYLGYKPLPGAQLRYILSCEAQPIALLGFGRRRLANLPAGPLHRLEPRAAPAKSPPDRQQCPFSSAALGPLRKSSIHALGKGRQGAPAGLASDLWLLSGLVGDLR